MTPKSIDPDILYNKIVHFYIDKKKYSKEDANKIAQNVIKRELQRRICKNQNCHHSSHEHLRNSDTCIVLNCDCTKFIK